MGVSVTYIVVSVASVASVASMRSATVVALVDFMERFTFNISVWVWAVSFEIGAQKQQQFKKLQQIKGIKRLRGCHVGCGKLASQSVVGGRRCGME